MPRTHDNGDEDNGARPTFDFSGFSHRSALLVSAETLRLQRLAGQLDGHHFDTDEAFEDALMRYQALVDVIEGYACQVLVSVPPSWLVDDAPADLDWSQPDSLGWLRQDRYRELQELISDAKRPENVSKNLAKR